MSSVEMRGYTQSTKEGTKAYPLTVVPAPFTWPQVPPAGSALPMGRGPRSYFWHAGLAQELPFLFLPFYV